MSKKLIFVGPSGAGKTTIRKVFFEGVNSSKLLDYALEPTFGKESLILELFEEKIGVFDLAGQENKRWLDSADKRIFYDAGIIIIVIEATSDIKKIVNFSNNVLKVRNELASNSKVYMFLHKIDLLDDTELQILKREINECRQDLILTRIYFTSIKSQYLIQTFSYFLKIIKSNFETELTMNIIDSEFLNELIRLLYYLDKEVILTEKDIQLKLNISDKIIKKIINILLEKDHIDYTKAGNNKIYTLTEKGKAQFEFITSSFDLDNIYKFENDVIIPEFPTKEEIPPFIGFFISDENGRTFSITELYQGALNEFLQNPNSENAQDNSIDIELIPMFISALQKFSREINIKSLSGFNLRGINLKMKIMSFSKYTVTLFLNPEINLKPVKHKIRNYFLDLFDKHKDQLKLFEKSGSSSKESFGENTQKWLKEMNKTYANMIMKLESYDIQNAEYLYQNLDTFQEKLKNEFSILSEKIKKLKVKLMKAILNKNSNQIKQISKKLQDMKSKFLS